MKLTELFNEFETKFSALTDITRELCFKFRRSYNYSYENETEEERRRRLEEEEEEECLHKEEE